MLGINTVRLSAAVLFAVCALALLIGCSDSATTTQVDTRNFKAFGVLYGKFLGAHGGRKPANESELIAYISTKETDLLKYFSVEDPKQLLISARDSQPLTVVYGGGLTTDADPIAAFESQPTNGKRWVVWTTGMAMELDDAEFQKRKPAT